MTDRRQSATTFVIVHGAFGGGWEWTPVARLLRRQGHEVFTPTLTGLGERAHLGAHTDLSTHVEDVVALLEFEDLRNVVLCGASYGGLVVTGAADRATARVSCVIYIDALVPDAGQAAVDLLPQPIRGRILQIAEDRAGSSADGSAGLLQIPEGVLPPHASIPHAARDHYIARLRPQPVHTLTEPLVLSGHIERVPRAFIRCTRGTLDVGGDPIAPIAQRVRALGWPYRELAAPHDPHLFDAEATAAALLELAATLSAGRSNT